MVRKCATIAVITILIVLPIVIGAIYRNSAQAIYRKLIGYPDKITIATGPIGGLYQPLGDDLADTIENELNLHVIRKKTEGSLENLRSLRSREADFALYQPGTDPGFALLSAQAR